MTITINLDGRLGNQLFQYATLRNLSIKKGYKFYFNTNFECQGQENLLKYFNISNSSQLNEIKYHYYQPVNSNFFDSNIYNINDDTILNGYFENIEYFKENDEIIKNELTIKDKQINEITDKYIYSIIDNDSKLVGIHFRRGDILEPSFLHPKFGNIDNFNEFTKKYVYESLQTIMNTEKNITLLIFTGGFRKDEPPDFSPNHSHNNDLLWIQEFALENKSKFNIHISPGTIENNVLLDYSLISKCDYVIIPYLSTFSFMASYVSKNIIKLFTPKNLYGTR